MAGRALLIGASRYGAGLGPLSAVEQDIALMREALGGLGLETEVVDEATTRNASDLDRRMREFCAAADRDSNNVIYFSGHGLSVDGQDWIIPAELTFDEARDSAAQRVATDLSAATTRSEAGLILFVIDACRELPSGGDGTSAQWSLGARASGESRFIRMFGCGSDGKGRTLKRGHEGKDVSVFTKALHEVLTSDDATGSLKVLLELVTRRCADLAQNGEVKLPIQRPCFDFGQRDVSGATLDQLDRRIFSTLNPGAGNARRTVWKGFEPARLQCLVVGSEHAQRDGSGARLGDCVTDAVQTDAHRIWKSFRDCWHGRRMIDGRTREIPEAFAPSAIEVATVSVLDCFRSDRALDEAVVAVSQADLVVFDISRFEPGILLLMGIRAAVRRGLTISSHGLNWREGDPLKVPFNLRDLQIGSHSESGEKAGEDDPVARRLLERIVRGFEQLSQQPRYLDLPAYDSLRELGTGLSASGTIRGRDLVLLLCPFSRDYDAAHAFVRRSTQAALQKEKDVRKPRVRRLIDLASPQLVSQTLYEHIRRVSCCLMDWSGFSESAFLELGVRLAVSPWGAVQLIQDRCRPGQPDALRLSDTGAQGELEQIGLMCDRLQPIVYRLRGDAAPFEKVVREFIDRKPFDEQEPAYNRIHRVVRGAIEVTTPVYDPVHEELRRIADSLNDPAQERNASPQLIFLNRRLKEDRERAALERRIAAWLYLEHRCKVREREADDPLRALHRRLGEQTAASLSESERTDDRALAQQIAALLDESSGWKERVIDLQNQAKRERLGGETARKAGRLGEATSAFTLAGQLIDQAIDLLESPARNRLKSFATPSATPADQLFLANELVECHGTRGGIWRRLGDHEKALQSYEKGARLEQVFVPLVTYNRTNAVKCALLGGHKLAEVLERVRLLEKDLTGSAKANPDNGWTWADLGDCRALLGDVDGAERAYRSFIDRAPTDAPKTTLDMLRSLAGRLAEINDAAAPDVEKSLRILEKRLLGT